MPNIASILKSEIIRIVRKEIRNEVQSTKKIMSDFRTQITQLKRQVKALEQQVTKTSKANDKLAAASCVDGDTSNMRFSAKGLAAQRKRLDLSVVATAKI